MWIAVFATLWCGSYETRHVRIDDLRTHPIRIEGAARKGVIVAPPSAVILPSEFLDVHYLKDEYAIVRYDALGVGDTTTVPIVDSMCDVSTKIVEYVADEFQMQVILLGVSFASVTCMCVAQKAPQHVRLMYSLGGPGDISTQMEQNVAFLEHKYAWLQLRNIPLRQRFALQVLLTDIGGDSSVLCNAVRPDNVAFCARGGLTETVQTLGARDVDPLRIVRDLLQMAASLVPSSYEYIQAPPDRIEVPIVHIHGLYDHLFRWDIAKEQIDGLDAPCGTHFVLANHSSHLIHVDDPSFLRRTILDTLSTTCNATAT